MTAIGWKHFGCPQIVCFLWNTSLLRRPLGKQFWARIHKNSDERARWSIPAILGNILLFSHFNGFPAFHKSVNQIFFHFHSRGRNRRRGDRARLRRHRRREVRRHQRIGSCARGEFGSIIELVLRFREHFHWINWISEVTRSCTRNLVLKPTQRVSEKSFCCKAHPRSPKACNLQSKGLGNLWVFNLSTKP